MADPNPQQAERKPMGDRLFPDPLADLQEFSARRGIPLPMAFQRDLSAETQWR